jgi:uncharacterized membrane protein YccC
MWSVNVAVLMFVVLSRAIADQLWPAVHGAAYFALWMLVIASLAVATAVVLVTAIVVAHAARSLGRKLRLRSGRLTTEPRLVRKSNPRRQQTSRPANIKII